MDTGSPVSADYKSPNAFTGKIKKVTFESQNPPHAARGAQSKTLEREVRPRKAMSD